jgi:hypothetical protein
MGRPLWVPKREEVLLKLARAGISASAIDAAIDWTVGGARAAFEVERFESQRVEKIVALQRLRNRVAREFGHAVDRTDAPSRARGDLDRSLGFLDRVLYALRAQVLDGAAFDASALNLAADLLTPPDAARGKSQSSVPPTLQNM